MSDSSEVFVCNLCHKASPTLGRYNQHRNTHSKPHKCASCSMGFALRTDLNRHIKARHRVGNKGFLCKVSGCRFISIRKDNLQQHMCQSHGTWTHEDVHHLDVKVIQGGSTRSSSGETRQPELCLAAGVGNLRLVQGLISLGTDVSVKANDGSTPLHCASKAGHVDVVIFLLKDGRFLSERNDKRRTALQEAALENHVEVVRILMNGGGDAKSILDTVIKTGTRELSELLIESLGVEQLRRSTFNTSSWKGLSPLHLAAFYGNEPVLRALLLDPGMNPNETSGALWAPLHYAILSGHEGAVEILLGLEGIDVNICGRSKRTPLHVATIRGNERIVQRLLACENLDVNAIRGCPYYSAAHLAVRYGALSVLKLLLHDKRLDMSCLLPQSNKKRDSLLQTAVDWRRVDILECILSTQNMHKLPNFVNDQALLHHAAACDHDDMIELLLAHKDIDINARQETFKSRWWKGKKTALQIAREQSHKEIVLILLAKGAIDDQEKDLAVSATSRWNESHEPPLNEEAARRESSDHLDLDLNLKMYPDLDLNMDMDMDMDGDMDGDWHTALDMENRDGWLEEFSTNAAENEVAVGTCRDTWRPWET